MQVTIEGVVSTDVCRRGEQHTVEWTPHLRQLVRGGLVKVVQWHHPEVEPTQADGPVSYDEGGALPDPVVVVASSEEPVLSAEETAAVVEQPKRSRRRRADTEE